MARILVLFDGAGLARLGLEQAGHECLGVELDPNMHKLSQKVGSGNCILGDAQDFEILVPDFKEYDACWASPPCSKRSSCIKDLTRQGGLRDPRFQQDYVDWCLSLQTKFNTLWVENVMGHQKEDNKWGRFWNAAQFLEMPIQCRNRIVGGNYQMPEVYREYKRAYPEFSICPCISATEYKGCPSDNCRASRFYGRKLTVQECAYHQGFEIPEILFDYTYYSEFGLSVAKYKHLMYNAIGNGVPVYMAERFGRALN